MTGKFPNYLELTNIIHILIMMYVRVDQFKDFIVYCCYYCFIYGPFFKFLCIKKIDNQ